MRVNRIVGQATYSLDDVLKFRRGVYDTWYDSRITVKDGMNQDEIADEIIRELKFGSHINKSEKVQRPNSRNSNISNVQVKEYKDMSRVNDM